MFRISAPVFLRAFVEAWDEQRFPGGVATCIPSDSDRAWTKLMVGDGGLFSKVTDKLRSYEATLTYRREIYTVDGVIVGGVNLFRDSLNYPSAIHALIEHELGYHLEEEMWKLLHWRAPIKILVTYDWSEKEKSRSDTKRLWLNSKLRDLWRMHDAVEEFQGEEQSTTYLILVGDRETPQGPIKGWRYASTEERSPISLL